MFFHVSCATQFLPKQETTVIQTNQSPERQQSKTVIFDKIILCLQHISHLPQILAWVILRALLPLSGKGELMAPCSFRLSFDCEQSHRFPVNLETATASATCVPGSGFSHRQLGSLPCFSCVSA